MTEETTVLSHLESQVLTLTLHPGKAVVAGKGVALEILTRYGLEQGWIIGDGEADCIEGNDKVRSFLLGQLSLSLGARAARTTTKSGISGALELITCVREKARR